MSNPRALTVVAWLFIAEGAVAAVETGVDFYRGHGTFRLTALVALVGIGLLRRDAWWRSWALFWSGLAVITSIGAVLVLLYPAATAIKVIPFGLPLAVMPRAFGFVIVLALLAVNIWRLRVLLRPDIKMLFAPSVEANRLRRGGPEKRWI